MAKGEVIRDTKSVCPVCLRQIPARRVRRDGQVYMEKECPDHGAFSTVVWRDREDLDSWLGDTPSMSPEENPNCPHGCGLCEDHKRDTCCVLLEITERCNLHCKYCFADNQYGEDPSLDTVKGWLRDLVVPGKTLVQLSGGEPTVREDLPEIIAYAKEVGCKYVQLNTNGLRLAEERAYVKKLAEAGLSFVFLQFDGIRNVTWERLRGRPLAGIKKQAIANCGAFGLGVTLVPTLVPGINTPEIGKILDFAVENSPTVRGVHFQPVSYMGHIPSPPRDEDRFTLDELLDEIRGQAEHLVDAQNLAPSACDHPLCGFHGDFIVLPGHTLMPLTHRHGSRGGCCCGVSTVDPAEKNREFVGRRWERQDTSCCCCGSPEEENTDMTDMEQFLSRARTHGFTITSMAFQDAGNLDVERLRQCSLHVYKNGKKIPFCAHYLTPQG